MNDDTFQANDRTALVLGAAGFIGRHVCRRLAAQGFSVQGLGHGQWTEEERRVNGLTRWLDTDITANSLRAVTEGVATDVIIHCAGSGAVSQSFNAPGTDYHRSVETTLAMLEFARAQAAPPCIVLASSAAVYGDQGNLDVTEDAPARPMSPYGYHKLMAEMLCESYSRFFSLKTRVVRLFSVYGEGLRKQLLWDALNKFQRGTPSFFGTGEELRDWIHVEDAARLLVLAAIPGDASHAVYNGGHVLASTREVLSALAQAAHTPLTPVFSGEIHTGNPSRLTGSHERALQDLGFGGAIGLQEGLRRYAAWFKAGAVA
jgi:UDP-glucose 4-epimerase